MNNPEMVAAFAAFEQLVSELYGQPMAVIGIFVPAVGGPPDMLTNAEDAIDIMAFCVEHHAEADAGTVTIAEIAPGAVH